MQCCPIFRPYYRFVFFFLLSCDVTDDVASDLFGSSAFFLNNFRSNRDRESEKACHCEYDSTDMQPDLPSSSHDLRVFDLTLASRSALILNFIKQEVYYSTRLDEAYVGICILTLRPRLAEAGAKNQSPTFES